MTDLAQTGLIIDTAVQNGANHISNIVFTLSDDHRYYRQALQLAIQNAYQKAQTMTQTIRVQLFPVPFHITELMPSRPQPFQAYSLKASNAAAPNRAWTNRNRSKYRNEIHLLLLAFSSSL